VVGEKLRADAGYFPVRGIDAGHLQSLQNPVSFCGRDDTAHGQLPPWQLSTSPGRKSKLTFAMPPT
jgi:hypothetical protein